MSMPLLFRIWQELQAGKTPLAVFAFTQGLERLPITADDPDRAAQVQRFLRDYAEQCVGIYDASVSFEDFCDDVTYCLKGKV